VEGIRAPRAFNIKETKFMLYNEAEKQSFRVAGHGASKRSEIQEAAGAIFSTWSSRKSTARRLGCANSHD
jgi:hypothetical protein